MIQEDLISLKLKTIDELKNELFTCNGTVAVCSGCFDCLHVGHLSVISRAKDIADTLIMAINSDKAIKQLKGETRPIVCEQDRAFFLASLSYVDYVVIFDSIVIDEVLKEIQPDYLIKGGDYTLEKMTDTEKKIFIDYQIEPVFIPSYKDYSTTNILSKL